MVSGAALTHLLVFAIYATVFAIVYRRLFPRLAPKLARLPLLLMAAQALLIAAHITVPHSWGFVHWLLNLDSERNIANALASTQLAFAGVFALAIAWLGSSKPGSRRGYFLTLGLVFLFLAQEEFSGAYKAGSFLFSNVLVWHEAVQIIGIFLAALTVWAALRSPRRAQSWHICLLAGFALMAIGGLVIDEMPIICNAQIVVCLQGCIRRYVVDETLEFLGSWLALVAMLGHLCALSPPPKARVRRGLFLTPVIWIPLLLWHPLYLVLEAHLATEPASTQFRSSSFTEGAWLRGYRIHQKERAIALELYTVAKKNAHFETGYSVHLVDQASAESIAGVDAHWNADAGPIFGSGRPHAYRQRIDLDIPLDFPANRALWVALTLWREQDGAFLKQSVIASDHQLLSDTQVILGELLLLSITAPLPRDDRLAIFGNGFTLYATKLPESATSGHSLPVAFTWGSEVDSHEDYAQFLHFGHHESGEWRAYDQQPLGARLPTRLWYSGLMDSQTWRVPLPADLAPGRYSVYTGLYRASDRERLPASDVNGASFIDARVPLGTLIIQS